jgi:UDP-N-acetylmuramate--alanine ligase
VSAVDVLEARVVHFVGIGGAGMSPLAELLAREGKTVTGSDLLESETTRHLRSVGVRVFVGHDARNLGSPDAVVHTAAVRADNPELAAARDAGIPLVRRADLLGALMRRKRSVAVSGAHGKTTTTAMIGTILEHAGLDPTVIVGGSFRGGGRNLRYGRGDVMVVEADEYDRAFFSLGADVAVITNIDLEHLDTYRDLDDLKDAFIRFADSGPADGVVVAGIESAPVAAIAGRFRRRCVTFAIDRGADVGARELVTDAGGTRFMLVLGGREAGGVALAVPGAHNVRNALAAIAATREIGVPLAAAVAALAAFRGMARRFEDKGDRAGVRVVDDYAHHPTEIAATLDAARRLHPKRRLVVLFQPHLYSRTRDLAADFGRALLAADVALIAPIYPAREAPIPGVSSTLIADAALKAGHRAIGALASDEEVGPALLEALRPGDLLITMGAGDVAKFVDALDRPE